MSAMSVRKNSLIYGGSKRELKEKIVKIYESLLKGEDLARHNSNFWNEFFLLKPKVSKLRDELKSRSGEELLRLKPNINTLFAECVKMLDNEHGIRVINALQTLSALFPSVCSRHMSSAESGFDVIDTLIGFDAAEQQMQCLLKHCTKFLVGDYEHSLKTICLELLLSIASITDNISQNTLLEYLVVHSMFDVLIQLLCNPESRSKHGRDVVSLISLLVNYRKYETTNPYIIKLSILDNELALNGYGQVLAGALSDLCHEFEMDQSEDQASWFSSITNIVGSMLGLDEDKKHEFEKNFDDCEEAKWDAGVLIALYEIVQLNRNFMTILAHIQTDVKIPSNGLFLQDDSPVGSEQSTLLVTFFQYCSIVMQDMKCTNNTKLCFIILTCIAEDQYANFYMHDSNLMFKVVLYRLPMRHRKVTTDSPAQTLAATLMDLLIEYIMSHMMNKFPAKPYQLCIGVIHRILCYQKKAKVRLNYQWKNLWSALISLLNFLVLNKTNFGKFCDVYMLGTQVVNIFNLFIMYGDSFLPSPNSYDELYYEIIRMHKVFDSLYVAASKYSAKEGCYKSSAISLTNCLINVRAIVNHFAPKIGAWLSEQSISTPSEDQILEVVRKNYGSLTLKLQDGLDQYEPYSEEPNHVRFFKTMMRIVVRNTSLRVSQYDKLDHEVLLNDFSSIT